MDDSKQESTPESPTTHKRLMARNRMRRYRERKRAKQAKQDASRQPVMYAMSPQYEPSGPLPTPPQNTVAQGMALSAPAPPSQGQMHSGHPAHASGQAHPGHPPQQARTPLPTGHPGQAHTQHAHSAHSSLSSHSAGHSTGLPPRSTHSSGHSGHPSSLPSHSSGHSGHTSSQPQQQGPPPSLPALHSQHPQHPHAQHAQAQHAHSLAQHQAAHQAAHPQPAQPHWEYEQHMDGMMAAATAASVGAPHGPMLRHNQLPPPLPAPDSMVLLQQACEHLAMGLSRPINVHSVLQDVMNALPARYDVAESLEFAARVCRILSVHMS